MTMMHRPAILTRRTLLATGACTVLISAVPARAEDAPDAVKEAQQAMFGDGPVQDGRVSLKLPPIAENGYSVPLTVDVDSPMTEADHVQRIAIFSPRNPVTTVAAFGLGPRAGRARVETRIRLAGTQAVIAVAEMSDGTLWSGSQETVVTLAACVVL